MSATDLITGYIEGFPDWRGQAIARVRQLTLEAAPRIAEEWKWNSPVWSQDGLVCSASAFKKDVRVTLFQGAFLEDPHHLFNDGFGAKATRSIKLLAGDTLNESAYQDLIRAAVAYNSGAKS